MKVGTIDFPILCEIGKPANKKKIYIYEKMQYRFKTLYGRLLKNIISLDEILVGRYIRLGSF